MEDTNPVSQLMALFGGLRPMMAAIGESHPNLLQNWEKTGRIPHYRRAQIDAAIKAAEIKVPARLLDAACPTEKKRAA